MNKNKINKDFTCGLNIVERLLIVVRTVSFCLARCSAGVQ
jgi:hypothetical protein